jgi:serine/threonine protein kinase
MILASRSKAIDQAAADSPTIRLHDTREGVVVGTVAYMSPEQARGQTVDKRTDIWAFGCVLYEMLTGRAAFPGQTFSDTVAAILDTEPAWTALPATVPTSGSSISDEAVMSRLTSDPANDQYALWSRDGLRLTFGSNRNGPLHIFEKAVDRSTDESLLVTPQNTVPADWSPDGHVLLYLTADPRTHLDIWALPIGRGEKPFPIIQSPYHRDSKLETLTWRCGNN